MQLGSRWHVGDTPHPGVPELLHSAIAGIEAEHAVAAANGSWTLTWLEGRPRVELIGSSAQVLADLGVTADGTVTARAVERAPGLSDAPAGNHADADDDDDDDDDDWLMA